MSRLTINLNLILETKSITSKAMQYRHRQDVKRSTVQRDPVNSYLNSNHTFEVMLLISSIKFKFEVWYDL